MQPNFIIIGGQRCATGWLAQCLREHPEVFVASDETRFFDRHFDNGVAWWTEHYFRGVRNESAVGEKTANYLSDPDVPARIASLMPKAKIICCLRNPIDRLNSAIMMMVARDPELKRASLATLTQRFPDLLDRGMYATHLKRYMAWFPRENILVTTFEEKQNNPLEYVRSVYRFLGVTCDYTPASLERRTKPGAAENQRIKIRLLAKTIGHRYSPIRKLYDAHRPDGRRNHLSVNEQSYLRDAYRSEICALQTLLGRNFSRWWDVG